MWNGSKSRADRLQYVIFCLFVSTPFLHRAQAQEYIISTVAGPGKPGLQTFAGDGGPATDAQMNVPRGVSADAAGNVYIADSFNNRIRKVSNGIIVTFAGGGATGIGDGSPAPSANLRQPGDIALDSAGSLYIADTGNGRIRRISGGIITTVAGGGTDAVSDGIPAINARLYPAGIAVDARMNIFVSDRANRVRRISPDGLITTVAGIYSERGSGSSGDGGPAKQAHLSGPGSLAIDKTGNLFIAEGRRIRRVSPDGLITTVYTPNTAESPNDLTVDNAGNVIFSEHTAIRRLTPDGKITTLVQGGSAEYSGDGGLADTANLVTSGQLAFDPAGNLYIADKEHNAVRVLRPAATTDVTPGSWDVTENIATPLTPEQLNAFQVMLTNADKYPASQRSAYIASVKTAEENARKQAEKGAQSKRDVCVASEYPLKSLLFDNLTSGACTVRTKSGVQGLSMEFSCISGDRKSAECYEVDRIDSTHLKGSVHLKTADSTGKPIVEMNRTFTGMWLRKSCAAAGR